VALVALLAYLPGFQATRSGELVEVERWFDHPVLLLGAAVGRGWSARRWVPGRPARQAAGGAR